jgi:hypothetical protein
MAYNKSVYASPPFGGSGYTKTQSGLCHFSRYAKDIGNGFVQRHRKHLEGNLKPDQETEGSGQCRIRGGVTLVRCFSMNGGLTVCHFDTLWAKSPFLALFHRI